MFCVSEYGAVDSMDNSVRQRKDFSQSELCTRIPSGMCRAWLSVVGLCRMACIVDFQIR